MCEKCPEKVTALIANDGTQFTEEDRDWLNELPEDMLDKFIPKAVTVQRAWDVIKTQAKPEDYIANIPEEVQVQINSVLKEKEERQILTQTLVANGAWTEDELSGMSFSILKKLDSTASVSNYAGIAGGSPRRSTVEGLEPLPLTGK